MEPQIQPQTEAGNKQGQLITEQNASWKFATGTAACRPTKSLKRVPVPIVELEMLTKILEMARQPDKT